MEPWLTEPDNVDFEYKGYRCLIRRIPYFGYLCGYLNLPPSSHFFGKDYDDIPLIPHGGLTFAQPNDGNWVIGFDCAHAFDLMPGMDISFEKYASYKTIEYVEQNLKDMIDDLIELEREAESVVTE